MKEEYYRTQNHAEDYDNNHDVVAYIRLVYADTYIPPYIQEQRDAERRACEEAEMREQARLDSIISARKEAAIRDSLARLQQTAQESSSTPSVEYEYRFTPWSIKTNLLYDAVLMPSLEIEYRINKRWSVNLEGTMAWWHNDGRHKYYQLATISPEARYWFKPQGLERGITLAYLLVEAGMIWKMEAVDTREKASL